MREELLLPFSEIKQSMLKETVARDSLSCLSLLTAEEPSSVRSSAGIEKNLSFVNPTWMNNGVHGAMVRHDNGSQIEARLAARALALPNPG